MTQPIRAGGGIASLGSSVATVILVVCAIAVTGMMAKRELGIGAPPKTRAGFTPQADWKTYATAGNRIGPADAKVIMVEFSDFQCPACLDLDGRLREARKRFPQDFAVVYRHFPISRHKFAIPAAIASECAAAQGRFAAMHAALFDHVDSIGVATWASFARKAEVGDIAAFERCLTDPQVDSTVQRDRRAALKLGVNATPTILIDGMKYAGSMAQTMLDSLVESALRKSHSGS